VSEIKTEIWTAVNELYPKFVEAIEASGPVDTIKTQLVDRISKIFEPKRDQLFVELEALVRKEKERATASEGKAGEWKRRVLEIEGRMEQAEKHRDLLLKILAMNEGVEIE